MYVNVDAIATAQTAEPILAKFASNVYKANIIKYKWLQKFLKAIPISA